MTFGRGRPRRPDDWPSGHVRARAAISERLDAPLEPTEARWLDEHLAACADCRTIEGAYAAQQRELWALRDTMPTPPRDLWARTAAAIEAEPRFREGRKPALGWPPRRYLAPSALLAAALVVAVAVGTLTSSLRPAGDGATGSPNEVAQASTPVASARSSGGAKATPMLVAKKIEYLSRDASGAFSIKVKNVDQVCSAGSTEPCDTGSPVEDHPINLAQDTESVFGSVDKKRLIVVRDPTSSDNGTISVVPLVSPDPGATPTPTVPASASATPSPTPTSTSTPTPTPTPTAPTAPPASAPPSEEPTPTPSNEPTASVAITPAPDGTIEIAHDVVLVGQSAAYSSSGTWFAFTARPVDGSVGPDIFVWKVGEPAALPVTSDHRSIFGSWSGDIMIGSTVIDVPIAGSSAGAGSSPSADGSPSSDASATPIEHRAAAFLLDPATASVTALPQTGQAWRPAVDPSGRRAVYWDGSIRPTELGGFAPDAGRLVLGDWGTGTSAPTEGPLPTALAGDQATIRHETTISAGPIKEWDARWDRSGTHVAIWIADDKDPTVGKLFLYTVDSFDGRIDLKTPLLDGELASAGYSISEGQLVWADPGADGTPSSEVHLAAWTEQGVGTVKSVTGPVIVIR